MARIPSSTVRTKPSTINPKINKLPLHLKRPPTRGLVPIGRQQLRVVIGVKNITNKWENTQSEIREDSDKPYQSAMDGRKITRPASSTSQGLCRFKAQVCSKALLAPLKILSLYFPYSDVVTLGSLRTFITTLEGEVVPRLIPKTFALVAINSAFALGRSFRLSIQMFQGYRREFEALLLMPSFALRSWIILSC